ncbi:MAG: F0F1 ATP synthase subunit B, partial [Pedobacter sp.]
QEMARLTSQNEELMKQARAERDEILKEAKILKDNIVNEAKTSAQTEGAKLIEKARIEIENQKKAALADLKGQVSTLSLDIAERVLRSQLDDKAKQQDLVNSLLKDVELN